MKKKKNLGELLAAAGLQLLAVAKGSQTPNCCVTQTHKRAVDHSCDRDDNDIDVEYDDQGDDDNYDNGNDDNSNEDNENIQDDNGDVKKAHTGWLNTETCNKLLVYVNRP